MKTLSSRVFAVILLFFLQVSIQFQVYTNLTSYKQIAASPVHAFSSKDEGPYFLEIQDMFHDLHEKMAPQNNTLVLAIAVSDPDGVDTVIGSYKLDSETSYERQEELEWTNITLELNGTFQDEWLEYRGFGPHFIIDFDHRIWVWHVKYYANDSLGNWNSTDETIYSYNLIVFTKEADAIMILFFGAAGVSVFATVVIIFVIAKRRKLSIRH